MVAFANPMFATDMLKVKDANENVTFVVTDDGRIGAGTDAPSTKLHAIGAPPQAVIENINTSGNVNARLDLRRGLDSGAAQIVFLTGSTNLYYQLGLYTNASVTNAFQIKAVSDPTKNITLASNGFVGINNATPDYLLTVGSGGAYSDGNAWYPSSSRSAKDNIKSLSKEDASRTLDGLKPVSFYYKKTPDQQHLGFIAEDVPDFVANNNRKAIDPMNIIAILTKVVQDQKRMLDEQSRAIYDLNEQVTELRSIIMR
jgi:hypothetical protein